jgi:hypothetical protein
MSKNQVGTLGFLVLTLGLCLCACRGPYSIAKSHRDLIGQEVELKQDMVIGRGGNFGISGNQLVKPREVEIFSMNPLVRIHAHEKIRTLDITCVVGKPGQQCWFDCVYDNNGTEYRFYWGSFEEASLPQRSEEIWRLVEGERE